jgi:hypothetical protein
VGLPRRGIQRNKKRWRACGRARRQQPNRREFRSDGESDMKTVSKLLAASICLGLSGVVYAQPPAMEPTKSAAAASGAAKPKVAPHAPSAPAETAADVKSKSVEHREHAVNAVPEASSKVKPAAKVTKQAAKPVGKEPSAEAPKAAK